MFSALPLKKSSILIIHPSRIPWFLNRGWGGGGRGELVRVLNAIAPCGWWGQHNMTAAHKTMFSSCMAQRPTVLDKIDGKFVPPLPPLPPNQGWEIGAFWLLRCFILDLGGMGVCCSILFCPRMQVQSAEEGGWS